MRMRGRLWKVVICAFALCGFGLAAPVQAAPVLVSSTMAYYTARKAAPRHPIPEWTGYMEDDDESSGPRRASASEIDFVLGEATALCWCGNWKEILGYVARHPMGL